MNYIYNSLKNYVQHKYQNKNWNNGFYTKHAILKNKDYNPTIMFIGTFNPDLPWNTADFFYGRGMYMWPILANLILHKSQLLNKPRTQKINQPSLEDIFKICEIGRLSFSDIISEFTNDIDLEINNNEKKIVINNEIVIDNYKDKPLNECGKKGWLSSNSDKIIEYINNNESSLQYIYFTFKSGGSWIDNEKKKIINSITVPVCSIFTPTANGFGKNLPFPFNSRIKSLAHAWVWNNLNNEVPVQKKGFGNLNHVWLKSLSVDPLNF